jgi:hypothetical protein
MTSTAVHASSLGYLKECRRVVMRSLEGLDEYQIRRPMTPTGTNMLGVVKHLVGIEAGYLGFCLGRPLSRSLPWIDDEEEVGHRDMWATADESRHYIVDLYRVAGEHSDAVLNELGLDAPAIVPWFPESARATTSGALLARVLKDTALHAGQLQILSELTDGRAGLDKDAIGDPEWWEAHVAQLEEIAREFRR